MANPIERGEGGPNGITSLRERGFSMPGDHTGVDRVTVYDMRCNEVYEVPVSAFTFSDILTGERITVFKPKKAAGSVENTHCIGPVLDSQEEAIAPKARPYGRMEIVVCANEVAFGSKDIFTS